MPSIPTPASAAGGAPEVVELPSEEDWLDEGLGDRPPSPAAQGDGQAIVPHQPLPVQPVPGPAVRPGGRQEPSAVSDGLARLVRVMVERRHHDGSPVVLESNTAMANRLGLGLGRFRDKVYAAAHAAYFASRVWVTDRLSCFSV